MSTSEFLDDNCMSSSMNGVRVHDCNSWL